jgi:hypothetical protein
MLNTLKRYSHLIMSHFEMPTESLNTNNVCERFFRRMKKDINMSDPFDEFICKLQNIYKEC